MVVQSHLAFLERNIDEQGVISAVHYKTVFYSLNIIYKGAIFALEYTNIYSDKFHTK